MASGTEFGSCDWLVFYLTMFCDKFLKLTYDYLKISHNILTPELMTVLQDLKYCISSNQSNGKK